MHTKVKNGYVLFWNGPFSNFDPVENGIIYAGERFVTSEQIFMWEKANFFEDDKSADYILSACQNPMDAKTAGRKVSGYDDAKWGKVRYNFMLEACRAKYSQSTYHKNELLKYGTRGKFVEASPYDGIWGIKLDVDHPHASDPTKWRGLNLLGKVHDQLYYEMSERPVLGDLA